jgi:exonuclease III
MRFAMIFMLCFSVQLLLAQTTFKVLSYNVSDGIGTDKVKIKEFQTWMKTQNVDVAAFQYIQKTDVTKLANIAKKWKHPHIEVLTLGDVSFAITSKTPLSNIKKDEFLMATVNGINIYAVDINQDSIDFRIDAAKRLSQKINPQGKTLVVGRLKGYAPVDSVLYNQRFRMIPAEMRSDKKVFQQLATYQRPEYYMVLRNLLALGLKDLAANTNKDNTIIQSTYPTKTFGNEMPAFNTFRYDYALANAALAAQCKSVEVIKDKATDYKSAHYPLLITFELN